ncbi:MAG: hypothetical protein M3082_09590 [Candidatus Dormibacteraeota bacterium]|nr:hypothetical protein [Candidatus Dormibacteraeota bacterium]
MAGAGALAFAVFTAAPIVVGNVPGGSYDEATVASYVSIGYFPTVVVLGYLGLLGVLGLICLLAYLRHVIAGDNGRGYAANVFWGIGLASAACIAVSWGLVTGIALAAAEGGHAASVPHPETYVLSDTSLNVLFGSGAILLGFALIVLMLSSRGVLPTGLRYLTLVAGILATASPAFFPAVAIPIWGIVIGVWILATRRTPKGA